MLFATLPHPTPFMLVPVHLKTEESSYLHRSIGCSLSRQWRAGRAGHGWWLLTTPSWCWRCLPPVRGLCEFLTRLVSHLFKPVLWLNFYYCGNCSQTENRFVSISKLTELRRFLTRRKISRASCAGINFCLSFDILFFLQFLQIPFAITVHLSINTQIRLPTRHAKSWFILCYKYQHREHWVKYVCLCSS